MGYSGSSLYSIGLKVSYVSAQQLAGWMDPEFTSNGDKSRQRRHISLKSSLILIFDRVRTIERDDNK